MRSQILSILLFVVLLVVGSSGVSAVEVKEQQSGCSQYTRCSECVFDSTSITINRRAAVECAWCPLTGKCISASIMDGSCPANRSLTANSQCEDMQCFGARSTGNIYLCRFGMGFSLFLAVLLIVLSVIYSAWYRVIQQAPWRYSNLTQALGKLTDAHGGPWAASRKAAKQDVLSSDREYFVCKTEPKLTTYNEWALGSTEEERFWMQVKRYGFFPLAISGVVGPLCTVLLLTASLRPYFADVYYAALLTSGYGSLLLMAVYVRLFQPAVCHNPRDNTPETYVDLAIFLHGRNIDKVFPIDNSKCAAPPTAILPAAAAAVLVATAEKKMAAEAPDMTPLGVDLKSKGLNKEAAAAAATSGFELDETVPDDFRVRVSELVKGDETLLWFDVPDANIIGVEYNWMYTLYFIGFGFAIFLYALSDVTPYPDLLLPPSSLIVVALTLTIFCAVMFALLTAGCKVMYVLTSTRLIVIARSLSGTHNINSVKLADLKFCTLQGYMEMGHLVMNVAWEKQGPALRRMPKFNTDRFVGVKNVQALLQLLVPLMPSNALPPTFHDDLVHQRYVWRSHATINIFFFFLSPVLTIYSKVFPGGFSAIAMVLVMLVNITVLRRAVRVLTSTVAPITVSMSGVKADETFSMAKTLMQVTETIRKAAAAKNNYEDTSSTSTAAP